jgi:hypothetical protein
MTVRLNIEGVEYTAINAAEESTLQDILNAMQGQTSAAQQQAKAISKNQQNQAVNTQQSNQALGNFSQAARRTENTLEDLERSADQAGGTLKATAKEVYTGFSSAIKNIGTTLASGELKASELISGIGSAAAAGIDKLTTGIGTGIGGLFGGPMGAMIGNQIGSTVGGVAGDALTLFTGALTTAIGVMEGFAATTRTLANEGVVFGEGISKATDEILLSGMTLAQFTKMVQESGDSLRLLGGSASTGAKRLLATNKETIALRSQFLNLGFEIEEIPGLVADYAASLERFGGSINNVLPRELANRTLEYSKNLRVLADLTGDDVKTVKQKMNQAATDARMQDFFIKMQEKGITDITTKFGAVSAEFDKMDLTQAFKEYMIYGTVIGDKAVEFAQSPGLRQLFEQMSANLQNADPTVNLTTFTDQLAQSLQDSRAQISEDVKRMAPIAALSQQLGEGALNNLGLINQRLDELQSLYDAGGVAAIRKNVEETAKNQTALNEGIVSIAEAEQKIKESLQGLAKDLTETSAPLITNSINILSDAIKDGADSIRSILKDPNSFYKDLTDVGSGTKAEQDAGAVESGVVKMIDLFSQYTTSLIPGVSNFGESYYRIEEWLSNLAKADEEATSETKSMLDSIWDLMTTPYEQPTQNVQNPPAAQQTGPRVPMPEAEEQNIKTKAYGDIMNPKPGGHIVRVAEAGQPEVIAPATRGSNGKLGLEVSGAMLDNSRLLQSLLKVNEGQAAMMAGLNDKMSNMSGHMENLVSAQRQANRLAV